MAHARVAGGGVVDLDPLRLRAHDERLDLVVQALVVADLDVQRGKALQRDRGRRDVTERAPAGVAQGEHVSHVARQKVVPGPPPSQIL